MSALSDLDPSDPPELRRFEHTDPDMLLNVTETCSRTHCSLQDGHEGPHAEISPFNGMIYDVWGTDGAQVSEAALRVARKINRVRNEAIAALDEAHMLRHELRQEYKGITKDKDPILRMLLDDYDYWPDRAYDLDESGFEAESDRGLRDEIMRIYEGDG